MKILIAISSKEYSGSTLGLGMKVASALKASTTIVDVGEKINDLEAFYPERIADRILGRGDIISLVEKASENIDQKEMEVLAKKMSEIAFSEWRNVSTMLSSIFAALSLFFLFIALFPRMTKKLKLFS